MKPKKRNLKRSAADEGMPTVESATGGVDAAKEGNRVTRKNSGAASGTTSVSRSNVPAGRVNTKRNKNKTEERDSGAGFSQDSSLGENNQEVPDSASEATELENSDLERSVGFVADSMSGMGSPSTTNEADSTQLGAGPKSLLTSPSKLSKKNQLKRGNVANGESKSFTQPKKMARAKTREEASALAEPVPGASMSQVKGNV